MICHLVQTPGVGVRRHKPRTNDSLGIIFLISKGSKNTTYNLKLSQYTYPAGFWTARDAHIFQ